MTIGSAMRRALAAVALLSVSFAAGASAQPPEPDNEIVDPWEDVLGVRTLPDTAPGSITPDFHSDIPDADALYKLLTEPGRCPPRKPAPRRIPCAFIAYSSLDQASPVLRPIFKIVGPKTIWTFLDSKLAEVTIDDLWLADDVRDAGGQSYAPMAVVGFQENQANCKLAGQTCVADHHFRMFVDRTDILTRGCAGEIWGHRENATATQLTATCTVFVPDR
jgi:hypothetical protein